MYIENLRKFLKYFGQGRKWKLFSFLLLSIIAGVLEFIGISLIYPFVMMIITPEKLDLCDKISIFNNMSSMNIALVLGGCAFIVFILKNLYMILFMRIQWNFLEKWSQSINNQFMEYYLNAPYIKTLKTAPAEKIYVLTKLSTLVANTFLMRALAFTTNLFIVVLILALIFWKFPIAGTFSLIFILSCVLIQNLIFKTQTQKLAKKLQVETKKITNYNIITVDNIKDIKIFGCETNFYNAYIDCGKKYSSLNAQQYYYASIPPYMIETLIVLTLLILGGFIVIQNYNQSSALIASFAMIVASIFRLAPALNRIQTAIINLPTGLNFVKELNDIYEKWGLNESQKQNSCQTDYIFEFKDKISLEDICFSYDNEKMILKNISLDINKNDFIGIIGLSGAGKSTLADVITGLLTPSSGKITIDGRELTETNSANFRKLIGYVPQELNVLDKSFRENIAWGKESNDIDDKRVKELLKEVQLWDVVQTYSDGMYSIPFVGENGLSRGQKQRLAIARALYRNPEILIFDEATSALDVKVEKEITDMLLNLGKNKTIVTIAHRLSTLKACNKLLYLKNGAIVDIGTFEELSAKHPDFAELVRLSSIQ